MSRSGSGISKTLLRDFNNLRGNLKDLFKAAFSNPNNDPDRLELARRVFKEMVLPMFEAPKQVHPEGITNVCYCYSSNENVEELFEKLIKDQSNRLSTLARQIMNEQKPVISASSSSSAKPETSPKNLTITELLEPITSGHLRG